MSLAVRYDQLRGGAVGIVYPLLAVRSGGVVVTES